jgi:hypothetical protein
MSSGLLLASPRRNLMPYFSAYRGLFYPADRGSDLLQNIDNAQPDYTVSHPEDNHLYVMLPVNDRLYYLSFLNNGNQSYE